MEIINNQYRFIETIYVEPRYSTLLVLDEKDQTLYQIIVPTGPLPPQFIDYIKENLLKFFFLDETYVVRFLGIGRIFSIDNVISISSRFFFISEYLEPQIDFTARLQHMSLEQKLDVVIGLCRSLNYVHANGFSYGGFSGNNLVMVFDGTALRIKISDFVGLKIKNYLDGANASKRANLGISNTDELQKLDQVNDMLSLGNLLLVLLLERPLQASPKQELNALAKLYEGSKRKEALLLPIIEKLINLSVDLNSPTVYYPYQVVQEIARAFQYDLSIIDSLQRPPELFASLIGRDKEVARIIEIFVNTQKRLEKSIALIEGAEGVGKSSVGITVATCLRFQNGHSFSFYISKDKTNDENWNDFVTSFHRFSETMGISDYGMQLEELHKKYEGLDLKQEQVKSILEILNQIPRNISLLIKIDDIHFADDFFLQTILYIAEETNIFFLLTYNANLVDKNPERTIYSIINNNEYKKIYLKNLTIEYIRPFLKNILEFESIPEKLIEHMFIVTSGNPQLLVQEMRRLVKEKHIVQDPQTGFWNYVQSVSSVEENKDSEIIVSSLLANKNITENVQLYRNVLEYISLFKNGAKEEWIPSFGVKRQRIKTVLKVLCQNMLLIQKNVSGKLYYSQPSELIQNKIRDNILEDVRIDYHKYIIDCITREPFAANAFELAYQYQCLYDRENARKTYLRLAFSSKRKGLLPETISHLLKALENTYDHEYLHIAKICGDLGAFFYEVGDMKQGLVYLRRAIDVNNKINDDCLKCQNLVSLMHVYDYMSKNNRRDAIYKKIKELLAKNFIPKIQAALFRMDGLMAYYANDHHAVVEYALKGIEIAKDIPSCRILLINLLRLAGSSYIIMGENDKAEEVFIRARKLAEKENYIRAKLWIELSLAQIYQITHHDTAMAYAICSSVEDESKQHQLYSTEIVAFVYLIYLYLEASDFEPAYERAVYALNRSKEIHYTENIYIVMGMLIEICQSQYKLSEAIDYYVRTSRILEKNTFLHILPDFYTFSGNFLQYIGDIPKSKETYFKLKNTPFKGEFTIPDIDIKESILDVMDNVPKADKKSFNMLSKLTSLRLKLLHTFNLFIEYRRIDSPYAKKLYDLVSSLEEAKLDESQLAVVHFIRSFYEPKEKISHIRKTLIHISSSKEPLLRIYCYCELAKHYIGLGDYDVAIAYYKEACLKVYATTQGIQKQYRYLFFIRHMLYVPYYNLEKLQAKDYDALYLTPSRDDSLISEEKFNRFSRKINNFFKNKTTVVGDYLIFSKKLPELSADLTKLVNNGIQVDIDTVLKKVAIDLLATNAAIITIDDDLRAKLVSTLLPDEEVWASGILDGIYASPDLSILEPSRIQTLVPNSCIDTAVLIPIYTNHVNYLNDDVKHTIIGYLYAESYLLLNTIRENSRKVMETYGPILGLVLHKWIIETSSNTDPLTGAFSRKSFNEAIKHLQTFPNTATSFLYYDLDSFKSINDTYGHRAGDMVLATVAQVVMNHLQGHEKLYRYGGEEFVVILPDCNSAMAFEKAETIRKAVETTSFQGYRFSITMSIGISSYGEHSNRIADLIPLADAAMYFSKRTGKNKTTIWTTGIDQFQVLRDTLSRTIGMDRFWNVTTASLCIDILKNLQSSSDVDTVLYGFLQHLVKDTNLLKAGFLFVNEKNKTFAIRTDDKTNKIDSEIYQDTLQAFAQSRQKDPQVYPLYTKPDNFFSISYILCVPCVFRDHYLGILYGISPKKKTFSADDISLVTFLTTLVSPCLYELYETLLKGLK